MESLSISIPREAVHHHNLQNVRHSVQREDCSSGRQQNPVFCADILRILGRLRASTKKEKVKYFLKKTVARASIEKESAEEEILKVKQKFRASSYANKVYDFGKLFDQYDLDGNGTLDVDEIEIAVKRILPFLTRKQLKALINAMDDNKNGVIERKEFIEFIGSDRNAINRISKKEAVHMFETRVKNRDIEPNLRSSKKEKLKWDNSTDPYQTAKHPKVTQDSTPVCASEIRKNGAIFQVPIKIIRQPVDEDVDKQSAQRKEDVCLQHLEIEDIDIEDWWRGIMEKKKQVEIESYKNTSQTR